MWGREYSWGGGWEGNIGALFGPYCKLSKGGGTNLIYRVTDFASGESGQGAFRIAILPWGIKIADPCLLRTSSSIWGGGLGFRVYVPGSRYWLGSSTFGKVSTGKDRDFSICLGAWLWHRV